MSEEDLTNRQGSLLAPLQLLQEELAVELVDLLDVAEDDVSLASQRLRYVLSDKLGNVVLHNKQFVLRAMETSI